MILSFNHGYYQLSLGAHLRNHLDNHSVVSAVTLSIDGKLYLPDLSVYAKREINRAQDTILMTEMPLLVIEILSPTQGTYEILEEFKAYFAAGVKSCWLVEPVAGVVVVYSNFDKSETFCKNEIIDTQLSIQLPITDIFN